MGKVVSMESVFAGRSTRGRGGPKQDDSLSHSCSSSRVGAPRGMQHRLWGLLVAGGMWPHHGESNKDRRETRGVGDSEDRACWACGIRNLHNRDTDNRAFIGHLLCARCVASYVIFLCHLIFIVTREGSYCSFSHFPDEETEAQRGC